MSFPALESQDEIHEQGRVALPEGPVATGTRSRWIRKVAVIGLVLGAAGLAAWKIQANLADPDRQPGKRASGGSDRPIAVTAVPVQQQSMPIYLSAPGTVTPYYSVTLRTRVDGQLIAVNIREGQQVRKGQLLAQIDPAPFNAALAQAEGQLAKDEPAATYANAAAERMRALFEAGVVSKDRAQTSVANAGQAEGAIRADKAAIQAAKVNQAFTRIVSPIDGVVGLRQVDPGNIVHTSDATGLFLITQQQPISVIFTVPEDQLPMVRAGLHAGNELAVEAYDHADSVRLASGTLLTLDNEIDTSTGTDRVKAVFANKDGALFPNQFVHVRLILREEKDALVIPAAAVQNGSGGTFVYVARRGGDAKAIDGLDLQRGSRGQAERSADHPGNRIPNALRVTLRPISIEATEGSAVIISKGLQPGEQVIIDGFEKLKEGSLVSVRSINAKQDAVKEGGTSMTSEAATGQGLAPRDGSRHSSQDSRK